jgi:ubiquinone/menaquinone biosynthesis C-methylase UbiE
MTESEQDRERQAIREKIAILAQESQAKGSNTDWFEEIYTQAQGDTAQVPWAKLEAHPQLQDWLNRQNIEGTGKKALVIGCGLGDDAETLASYGFQLTAFDIAPTAIAWCRHRFPDSSVIYLVDDLLRLEPAWYQAFDLVIESRTIQSLPLALRAEVIQAIARTVAPQGTLLVIAFIRPVDTIPDGPPWPVSEQELSQINSLGFEEIERIPFIVSDVSQFFLEYRRLSA